MYSKFGYTVRHVPDFDNVPDELRRLRCFLLWKLLPPTEAGKKPRKVPFNIHGQAVSSKDLSQCCTLEEARQAYIGGGFDGIGVNLEAAGLVGIDLDGLRELAEKHPWFRDWWAEVRASGAFVEFSPSGTGVHIYLRAALPFDGAKLGGFEAYKNGRYTTLTCQAAMPQRGLGELIGGEVAQGLLDRFVAYVGFKQAAPKAPLAAAPQTQTDIALELELVNRVAKIVAEKHPSEWRGDFEDGPLGGGYGGDASRGESALARFIARVLVAEGVPQEQGHAALLAVLMKSAAGEREKWQTRSDYLGSRLFDLVADEWRKQTPAGTAAEEATSEADIGDANNTRAKFRQQFALVPVAADVLVYDSESHIRTALMRVSTFKTRYGNEFIDGKPAPEVWLRDPQRTTVAGVDCFPGALPLGFVNTWRGLALKPKAGDVAPYLNFVRDVACSGNATVSDYVIKYMAHMVQKPAELPETALVMTGPEGIGKGAFTAPLLEFVGDDASFIGTRAGQIAGQFNSQIQGALLVVANEVCFAGRVEDSGSLKALITENRIAYEEKGVPVRTGRNFARVIVSTNAKLAVEASAESRRFVVLDFSAAKKQDFAFFGSLAQWRENGGAAALLHHLLNIDLNGWHPRQIPTTKSLRGQRLEFLKRSDIVAAWWLGCLEAGCIDDGVTVTDGWPEEISARALEASLARDAGRHSQRWADAVKRLAKLTPEGFKRVDRTRQHSRFIGYTLPKLEACITAFEVATGTELERAA